MFLYTFQILWIECSGEVREKNREEVREEGNGSWKRERENERKWKNGENVHYLFLYIVFMIIQHDQMQFSVNIQFVEEQTRNINFF